MFAIAFDLTVKEVTKHHPKSVAAAYADIGATLAGFGFRWVQGSIYVCEDEDMANLMDAMDALTDLPWFPLSVRDVRAFRVEQWSNFTDRVKRRGIKK
ncbi:virulence factor [Acidithiobacillus thiooxidans]|uniref:Endoribonuclease VapD n=1 Tax=Acidithiobacillus thiooxidans TaxID=930 RepID=A0A1C2I4T7_ACITH|nr:virulence factor [Acidithiobacillus thiooxidans]OCX70973.1 virulence factor [Acidithiobacillus thiooxidans]OCX83192.1 virulence factor [Acidithiobacillus thiooxidans]